jgi:hypothetical protein
MGELGGRRVARGRKRTNHRDTEQTKERRTEIDTDRREQS